MSDFITMFGYLFMEIKTSSMHPPYSGEASHKAQPQPTDGSFQDCAAKVHGIMANRREKRGTYRISAPPLAEPSTTLLILKQLD